MNKKVKNAKKVSEAIDEIMDKEIVLNNSKNKGKNNKDNTILKNKLKDSSDEISIPVIEEVSDSKNTNSEINYENKNTNKKVYLGYNQRLLINVFGIILFILLAVILLVCSITIKARSNVIYKQTSNLDYKVYLKENDYYNEPYLKKNMQYIANLIDNVDVDFNYNFSINQNINYTYTYYIKSDILVTDTQDESKIIYSKTDKLTEPKVIGKDNSNGFNINENVKIDYSKYNDLVKSFKSSYAINADSNLVLSLCIEIQDEKGNIIRNINSNDTMKLTIPLTEQMINIKMDYNEVNNSDNVKVYKDFNISNKVTFALSLLSLIISIVFIIRLLLFIKKTSAKKSIYDITLSKILREYDRVIVNSRKIVDLNEDVIDVNSFNELLDVRDNLEKPIIFNEIHKGQKSIFIVKTPNETYRYILKLVDLENKEKN